MIDDRETAVPPSSLAARLWHRIPALLRAILVGFLVLQVGGAVSGALLLVNLKLSPRAPWFLPATIAWLWLFWRYANGWGWPPSTSRSRRVALRGRPLSGRVWAWSLFAGLLGMASVMGLVFVTARFGSLPPEAARAPFDVTSYPWWTVLSIFLAIAATAGVVEEAAFRGYMLSTIQRRHGWLTGIAFVGLMFYLAHLSHAYATLAFLPFFLIYSGFHGLLVYLTRSILPSVVLHSIADFVVVPMQFGVVPDPGHLKFVTHGGFTLVLAAAAALPFRRLAAVAREEGLAEADFRE